MLRSMLPHSAMLEGDENSLLNAPFVQVVSAFLGTPVCYFSGNTFWLLNI